MLNITAHVYAHPFFFRTLDFLYLYRVSPSVLPLSSHRLSLLTISSQSPSISTPVAIFIEMCIHHPMLVEEPVVSRPSTLSPASSSRTSLSWNGCWSRPLGYSMRRPRGPSSPLPGTSTSGATPCCSPWPPTSPPSSAQGHPTSPFPGYTSHVVRE